MPTFSQRVTHNLRKFNNMLEFPRLDGYPERVVAVLECRPVESLLRLLTVT